MALSVTVRDVAHAYGSTPVLHDLSFALAPGEIGCLLGPSGCGKSTLLRCVAGFEPVRAGTIALSDTVVSTPAMLVPPERRSIGMVFQDYALFPHLTVAGNVAFGLSSQTAAARSARVREMLDLVGMQAQSTRYPHELSGGQQQRVALARALAPAPGLMLLDEPFSSLDVDLRERLSLEVRAILQTTGTTALLVTHDQREAFAFADVIGVMREGAIEQWAAPYDLYHEPHTRFVADFVGEGVFVRGVGSGRDTVETELGVLPTAQSIDAGTRVDVLLRPDDIVHDDHAGQRARIVSKSFRGAEFMYALCLPSGARVLSLVPSHHDHAIGEMIGIRLEVEHVVAFPAT